MASEYLGSLEGGDTMPHRGIVLPPLILFFGNGIDCTSALLVLQHQINHHFPRSSPHCIEEDRCLKIWAASNQLLCG